MAGALSALGMLLADRQRDFSIGALGRTDYEARFRKLEKQAARGWKVERFADVRYSCQSYELTIPWGASFHKEHHRVYGYSDSKRPTQIVTLRVRASLAVERPRLRKGPREGSTVYIPDGWATRGDSAGSLILTR